MAGKRTLLCGCTMQKLRKSLKANLGKKKGEIKKLKWRQENEHGGQKHKWCGRDGTKGGTSINVEKRSSLGEF